VYHYRVERLLAATNSRTAASGRVFKTFSWLTQPRRAVVQQLTITQRVVDDK